MVVGKRARTIRTGAHGGKCGVAAENSGLGARRGLILALRVWRLELGVWPAVGAVRILTRLVRSQSRCAGPNSKRPTLIAKIGQRHHAPAHGAHPKKSERRPGLPRIGVALIFSAVNPRETRRPCRPSPPCGCARPARCCSRRSFRHRSCRSWRLSRWRRSPVRRCLRRRRSRS